MKTGFKDPIAIKKQVPEDKPMDGVRSADQAQKKTPWDYRCPRYDERSSCFVNAGTHYGIAHKQPVGSQQYKHENVIPSGKHIGLRDDEVG